MNKIMFLSLSLSIINFKLNAICDSNESKHIVYGKAKQYCEKLNDWRLKNAVKESITIELLDLFTDSKSPHVDDLNNLDSTIMVAIYLDKWSETNFEISCKIMVDENLIHEEICNGSYFYVVPINKTIINKENNKSYSINERIFFESNEYKIDCILSKIDSVCTLVNTVASVNEDEINDVIQNVKEVGNSLFKEGQYNNAKTTFENVLKERPNDKYSLNMLDVINEKHLSIEDEINNAIINAYSGKIKKMTKAFKVIYAYQNHKLVTSNGCLFFFMANMLEYYDKDLNLYLSEQDRAFCVRQFVKISCLSGCKKTQEFLESLPPIYRIKYSIKCD